MTLLSASEQKQVAEAIAKVEQQTDAELVTVLARSSDDYTYIPLLWAGIVALLVPGVVNFLTGWFGVNGLLMAQWSTFIGLCLVVRVSGGSHWLVPKAVRFWRASNLVDHGISSKIENQVWESIVSDFTAKVRQGRTLEGFVDAIGACGDQLKAQVPATREKNELPNRLVML